MKTYRGAIGPAGRAVYVDTGDGGSYPLVSFFPFAWGYTGHGPSALALAILTDFLGGNIGAQLVARAYRRAFEREIIASLTPHKPFALAERGVRRWIEDRATNRETQHA